jgi:hypothetical protein
LPAGTVEHIFVRNQLGHAGVTLVWLIVDERTASPRSLVHFSTL